MINRAVGPVWEVNHVWLIFCLVVLWTAFPPAFGSIMTTLSIPLSLAVLGIVLRGTGFAFRDEAQRLSGQRALGAVFAISSVLTPFFFGTAIGGIVSGRVPVGNAAGDLVTSWLNPTSIVIGLLAVAVCAYLAGVFLVTDAHRLADADLEDYFRDRAIGAAVVASLVAVVGIWVLRADDRFIFDALAQRGWRPDAAVGRVRPRGTDHPAQERSTRHAAARGRGGRGHRLGLGRCAVPVLATGVADDRRRRWGAGDLAMAGHRRRRGDRARRSVTRARVSPRPVELDSRRIHWRCT